jgi:hypothetical protein
VQKKIFAKTTGHNWTHSTALRHCIRRSSLWCSQEDELDVMKDWKFQKHFLSNNYRIPFAFLNELRLHFPVPSTPTPQNQITCISGLRKLSKWRTAEP